MISRNKKAPCDKRASLSNLIGNGSIIQTGCIENCLQFLVRYQGWLYQVLIPKQSEPARRIFSAAISDKELALKFVTDSSCLQDLFLDSIEDLQRYKLLLRTMVLKVGEVKQ